MPQLLLPETTFELERERKQETQPKLTWERLGTRYIVYKKINLKTKLN